MLDTSPLDKGKKSSESLPTWTWYLQVVAGIQTLINLRLSMASSMRVVHQMTRPTVACYYGLKIIKDLGLPVSKRVRFVVGTDEESGWGDMDYYFKHVGLPDPDFGFSPDAEFPIINGEKEILPSTFTSVVKIQVKRIFIASQVAFVKTWYQSQRQQSFLGNYQI